MKRENIVWTALAILACGGLLGGCASAKPAAVKPRYAAEYGTMRGVDQIV